MLSRRIILISTVAMLLAVVQSTTAFSSIGLSYNDGDEPSSSDLRGPRQHVLRVNIKSSDKKGSSEESMLDVLRKDRRFSKLVEAVGRAGGNLRNDLEEEGRDKTLLAPTNDAFEVMERTWRLRVEDMSHQDIGKLIRYHIIPKDAYSKDNLRNGDLLKTALNNHKPLGDRSQVIRVYKQGERVLLNMYSQIIDSDIQASNGIIHAVSDVLQLPRSLFETLTLLPGEFSTQALALQLTGLAKEVDNTHKVTALVASNSAWENLGIFELMSLFAPEGRDRLRRVIQKHYVPNVAYIREIAAKEGITKEECARRNRNNRHQGNDQHHGGHEGHSITRQFNTWADERVTLRITCRGGQMKAMVDEASISLEDLPADNGVAHILSTPLVLNKGRRQRDSDYVNNENGNDDDENDDDENNLSNRRRRRRRRRLD